MPFFDFLTRRRKRGETGRQRRFGLKLTLRGPAREKEAASKDQDRPEVRRKDVWNDAVVRDCNVILQRVSYNVTPRLVPVGAQSCSPAATNHLPAIPETDKNDTINPQASAERPPPPPSPSAKIQTSALLGTQKTSLFRQSASSSTYPLLRSGSNASLRQSFDPPSNGSVHNAPRDSIDNATVTTYQHVPTQILREQEQSQHYGADVVRSPSPGEATVSLNEQSTDNDTEEGSSDVEVHSSGDSESGGEASGAGDHLASGRCSRAGTALPGCSASVKPRRKPKEQKRRNGKKAEIPSFDNGEVVLAEVPAIKDVPRNQRLHWRCFVKAAACPQGASANEATFPESPVQGEVCTWDGDPQLTNAVHHILSGHKSDLACPTCHAPFEKRSWYKDHGDRNEENPPARDPENIEEYCNRRRDPEASAPKLLATHRLLHDYLALRLPDAVKGLFEDAAGRPRRRLAELELNWAGKFMLCFPNWEGPIPYPYYHPENGECVPFKYEPVLKPRVHGHADLSWATQETALSLLANSPSLTSDDFPSAQEPSVQSPRADSLGFDGTPTLAVRFELPHDANDDYSHYTEVSG